MLRITRHSQAAATLTLKLEGRLLEPWAGELDRLATDALRGEHRLVLDLSGLLFVDPSGINLLRALCARGASLRGGSSFVAALLEGDHP